MDNLIQTLLDGNHSLVIAKDTVRTFDGRGVSDLFGLLHNDPATLAHAHIADKIVGKAAAALLVLAKVQSVYAHVISRPAYNLLIDAGTDVRYGTLVPHIINRAGTGLCPLETRCLPCRTPAECLDQIRSFIRQMKQQ